MPFLSISRRNRKSTLKPVKENIPPVIAEAISEFDSSQNVPEIVSEKIMIGLPDSELNLSQEDSKYEEEFLNQEQQSLPEIQEEIPEVKTEPEIINLNQEVIPQPEIIEVKSDNTDLIQPEETEKTELPEKNEEFKLKYDFTSGERYVDSISTKTEFDKLLIEIENMSKDFLSWEAEKFMKKFFDKIKSDENNTEEQATAKKLEAFLGGFINEAAIMLYDKGYGELAIKRLEQAKSILETKKRLEEETLAINTRVEESGDMVDLSDILSLLGDG